MAQALGKSNGQGMVSNCLPSKSLMSPIGQRRCDNEIKPRTGRTLGRYICVPLRAIAQAKTKEKYWLISGTEARNTLSEYSLLKKKQQIPNSQLKLFPNL